MPLSLYFAIATLILAGICFVIWRRIHKALQADIKRYEKEKSQEENSSGYHRPTREVDSELRTTTTVAKVMVWVFAVLTGLLVLNASVSTVPTKNVGIVSQFKAQTGRTTGAGLQAIWPWQKIDNWEASRQTFDHLNEATAVQVRIVGLQQAWVEVKIEWSVKPEKAPEQWASYKEHDFDIFVDRRINPNITGAINDAYETHNPLSNVDTKTGAINPPPKQPFINAIRKNLETRLGNDINVHDVVIGFIKYDDDTQNQIQQYQVKVLEGRNLEIDLANAEKRRQINEKNKQRDARTWCLEIAESKGKEPGICMGVAATPVVPVK